MACNCRLATLECQFSDKIAQRDLADYRENGPDTTTQAILDTVATLDIEGATLLDVGSGIGVLHHELLADGVSTATAIEPSEAYVRAAREEAERRGLDDRVAFLHGDLQSLGDSVGSADLVTLDRVVCCDPDMEALARVAAKKSRRFLVASYPNDRWHIRLFTHFENAGRAMRRNAFRTFVHPQDAIDAVFAEEGLARVRTLRTFVWQIVVYERTSSRV
jgi:magnesium-protoporphyrin O-methyltransferase